MIGRASVRLVRAVGFVVAGLAVLVGLAAWRLSTGPVTLTSLTPILTQALDGAVQSFGDLRVTVGETVVIWGGFEHPLALRLRDVRLTTVDGQAVAAIPELGVGFSVRALVQGRLVLANLTVVRPTLHLERTPDGRLVLDLNGPGQPEWTAAVTVPITGGASGSGVTAAWLDAVRHPTTDPLDPLAALVQVAVTDATLTIDDQKTGLTWSVPNAALTAGRTDAGIRVQGHLEAQLPSGLAVFDVEAIDRGRPAEESVGAPATPTTTTTAMLHFTGFDPTVLGLFLPLPPTLAGVHVVLSGEIDAAFDPAFVPQKLTLSVLGAEGGTVDLPMIRPEPLAVGAFALTAGWEPEAKRLVLERARLELEDPALIVTAAGQVDGMPDAPSGTASLDLRIGTDPDHVAPVHLEARLSAADHRLTLRMAGLEPARWAALVPQLAPLAAAAFPIDGTADVTLDARGQPTRVALDLAAAEGQLVLPPALLSDPVPIRSIALSAVIDQPLDPMPAQIQLKTLALDFGGPRVAIDGTVTRTGERVAIVGGVKAEAVPADRLPKLWPVTVGKHARDWITANITAGMIDEGWLRVDGSAPVADPSDILATTLDGGVVASNLTVGYFKTLPPIVGISGRGTSDGRALVLNTSGGHIGDLAVGDAKIVISKLDTPQEWIDIDAPLSGSLRSALEVLDTPPLRYAHRVDMDPAKTEGTQTCRLHFYFPLKKSIDIENVEIRAVAALHGAAIAGIAGGLTVTNGDLKLALDGTGMDVTGTTDVEGIPAAVRWRENFRDGADPRTRVDVKGKIGAADLARYGLHSAPYWDGAVGADVRLVIDHAKRTSVKGQLDLAPAQLALPALGWTKPPGTAGTARFTLDFDRGKAARVSGIGIEAAGLKAAGSLDLAAGGGIARATLGAFQVGATDLGGELTLRPGGEYDVVVRGTSLDARPLLKEPDDAGEKQHRRAERLAKRNHPPQPGPSYDLSIRLDRLITGEDQRGLSQIQGRLASRGLGWDSADLTAAIPGFEGSPSSALTLRYQPEGAQRRLTVTAGDAGAVLRALDVTDSLRGGDLKISGTGEPGFPVRPFTGQVTLGAYRVVGAPLLARVLNALSVTGLMELLQGQGLGFSQLQSDVTANGDEINLRTLRTSGGALGLTLSGRIDLAADTLAVDGTIVPLYGLNRMLGMVPVLGDWLSGGAGQGVFAATYALSGALDEPTVSVNPLAALAPGFLRNLLFLNDDKQSPAPSSQDGPPP
jgi:hypothetical protein